MLVLAAAIWGLGTVVIKDAVDVISPFWLVGIRFLSAGVLLSLILLPRMVRRLDVSHLKAGLVLGAFVALTYLLNTTGLAYTTASNSSFLTATYCVLVPFLAWAVMRKRPTGFNLTAAFLCIVGIGLVALPAGGAAAEATAGAGAAAATAGLEAAGTVAAGSETGFALGLGDGLTLASAVACGMHIVLISKLAPGRDPMILTALQFLVAGAIACGVAALSWWASEFAGANAAVSAPAGILNGLASGAAVLGGPPPSLAALSGELLASLAYLVVFATCVTLLLQNIGLAHVDPAPASLMLSTEALFGVVFSVLFLGETLTMQMICGFALIFAAVLVSEWLPLTALGRKLAGYEADKASTAKATSESKEGRTKMAEESELEVYS